MAEPAFLAVDPDAPTFPTKYAKALAAAIIANGDFPTPEVVQQQIETALAEITPDQVTDGVMAAVAGDPESLFSEQLSTTFVALAASTGGNDTAMLQSLIDAAAAAGLPLHLRANETYNVNALALPSGTVIEGNGALLRAVAGNNTYVLTNADRAGGDTGIVIRDLAVDGNAAEQTAQFNSVEFMRVSHCRFENLDVSGAQRNQLFPNGTNGDGLCLILSDHNEIIGGYFHDNTYDGIKLRSSDRNTITGVHCVDNGRSGIQLAFYSPSGPPYNENEGVESAGSNDNVLQGVTVTHSTGVPHAAAPVTSGIYLHTAYRNIITGLTVDGTRQGIGIYGGDDNQFIGAWLRTRFTLKAAISIDTAPGTANRNKFIGVRTRGISGSTGKHVEIQMGALTEFLGCHFARGEGTGDWRVIVNNDTVDNTWFLDCSRDGGLVDSGVRTIWRGARTSGVVDIGSIGVADFRDIADPGYPAAGFPGFTLISTQSNARFRFASGFQFSVGAGGIRLMNGGALPPASATYRGQIRVLEGAAGAADMVYMCRKKADESYEWAPLA